MKSIPTFNPKDLVNIDNYWDAYTKKHGKDASELWLHNLDLLKQNVFNNRHMDSLIKLIYNQTIKDDCAPGTRLAIIYENSPKNQDAVELILPRLRWDASARDELDFLCWDKDPEKIKVFYLENGYGYLLNVIEAALTAEIDTNYNSNLVFLLPVVFNMALPLLNNENTMLRLEDTYARLIGYMSDNLEPVLEQLDSHACFELLFVLNAIVTDINERHPDKAPISELRQDEYKTGAKQIQTSWTTRYPEAAHEYNKLNSLGAESYSIWLSFQTKSETELLPTLDF